MEILLRRIVTSSEATVGILSVDGKPACFTLEDQAQAKKVYAETRIQSGTYALKPREFAGMYTRYRTKFAPWHRGMIEIADVPEFTDILFHIGNRDDDTAGCILVGRKAVLVGRYTVEESRIAYEAFYRQVIDAVYQKTCQMTIVNDEKIPEVPTQRSLDMRVATLEEQIKKLRQTIQ